MNKCVLLGSNSVLENTIDKILTQTEKDIMSNLNSSLTESKDVLADSMPKLEREYDKIISDGKKEADKIEKQLIGSADLCTRNNKLLILEKAVDDVFIKATEQISKIDRNDDYSNLIKTLLDESTKILGTSKVTIFINSKDKSIVQSLLSKYADAELSPEVINCLGGIKIKSKDGTMTFDNTLDARIQRMKPLIRKEIATKFGVGN